VLGGVISRLVFGPGSGIYIGIPIGAAVGVALGAYLAARRVVKGNGVKAIHGFGRGLSLELG